MLSRSAAADPVKRRAPARVLPGFKITLGYTLMYLCLIVLIPLSALVFKTFTLTWDQFWDAVTGPRVMASYRLTFGASLIAALVNVVFGLLVARYKASASCNFPADALLPLAAELAHLLTPYYLVTHFH